MTMLYKRWSQIAASRRDESALRETASGRCWSFGELFAAGEREPLADAGGIIHPQGHNAQFILTLLAAWREKKVVLPLEADQTPPTLPPPPASCIHLKSTSATTGAPRVIAFAAAQLAADADHIVAAMTLRPDCPNLGVISMAHSYGFSNLVLPLLLHGVPLILAQSPLPEAVRAAAAESSGPLALPAVPAMWHAWHETDAIPKNVRLAISAGALLPLELERAVFESRRLKIHNFYGSSECGGIAYDTTAVPRTDESCVGSPLPGVELATNETGCLEVRSATVGETYFPSQSPALGNGRFETSDLVELVGGQVFWRGRASEVINVAGRKVSPPDIEKAIASHPAIRACLVFGAPSTDAARGEDVVACVVAKAGTSAAVLRSFLGEHIPAWQLPRDWWFVESLSPNRLGKVSRADWRRKYLERASAQRGESGGLKP